MNYKALSQHCEKLLEAHGDTALGVGWPNSQDAAVRYEVMMGLILPFNNNGSQPTLLDFGCGAGHLFEYIQKKYPNRINYTGVDISHKFISLCKSKYPNEEFLVYDFMTQEISKKYDYIIANGIFTQKLTQPFDEMMDYTLNIISKLFMASNIGIAFNVMSTYVNKQREDLFHVPVQDLIKSVVTNLSRHFILRNDYGLYDYTIYLYQNASHKTSYSYRE